MGSDQHGEPEHAAVTRTPGPAEALRRHRERTPPTAGFLLIKQMSQEERGWMTAMTDEVGRRHRVDPDDLHQDLVESLLRCDSVERDREGLRSWLRQRAEWKAKDRLRSGDARRTVSTAPDELAAAIHDDGRAPSFGRTDRDEPHHQRWSVERLRELGLTRDEAQVVLLICWGFSISLKEFADLVDRGYAKTRKDKERGLGKIEKLFDLSPQENAVFIAWREFGSRAAAAERLGMSRHDVDQILERAFAKIDRTLETGTGDDRDAV